MKRLIALVITIYWGSSLYCQLPKFFNTNTGSLYPANVFNVSNFRNQFVFQPTEFSGAYSGYITKLYFRSLAAASITLTNFSLKMKMTNMSDFPSGAWITSGMQTVLSSGSFSISLTSAGWFSINLQTPFYYNASQGLLIDISQTARTGSINIVASSTQYNATLYSFNQSTATSGNVAPSSPNFGFDITLPGAYNDAGVVAIDSPTIFCNPTQNIVARIMNFGKNQINPVTVNWSLNGVLQSPVTYTGTIDTLNGTGQNQVLVNLGSYAFSTSQITNIKAWTSNPNSVTDTFKLNDTTIVGKRPALNGTYTLRGTGANNFSSFDSANIALKQGGICAPVTFNVAAGTYTGRVVISGFIPGSSPTNTITFNGAGAANTIITSSDSAKASLEINSAKYVTVKNFSVINSYAGPCTAIEIKDTYNNGSASCNTVKNCVCNTPNAGTSNNFGIFFSGRIDSTLIDSNIIKNPNAWYGIGLAGAAFTSPSPAFSNCNYYNRIRYNIIENAYFYGIYLVNATGGSQIIGNTIKMKDVLPLNGFGNPILTFGIYHYFSSTSIPVPANISQTIIAGNTVSGASTGIFSNLTLDSADAPFLVYNNVVKNWYKYNYGSSSGTNCNGINISTLANRAVRVFHNTVLFDYQFQSGGMRALKISGTANIEVKNNILAAKGTGSIIQPFECTLSPTSNVINYNLYYNASNTNLVTRGGTTYNSNNFQTSTAGGDSSYFQQPFFVNDTNLHLSSACAPKGLNLNSLFPVDIDGQTRSNPPDMGADEFIMLSHNLLAEKIISPVAPITAGAQNLSVKIRNVGTNTITAFSIAYKQNGNIPLSQIWTGTLNPCDTIIVLFTGGNKITLGQVNNIKVYTWNPNSTSDNDLTNDTVKTDLYLPLNGTYTIGSTGTDFTNLSEAARALCLCGVSGAVKFLVNPGTYSEAASVVIPPTQGVSSINNITFDGIDASSRLVSGNFTNNPVLKIDRCIYVSLRNLSFTNTNASGSGVEIAGSTIDSGGSNCSISNCIINLPNSLPNTYGIRVGDDGCRLDSVKIDSNTITGGYYGISFTGLNAQSSSANHQYNRNIKVRNNTLNAIGNTGLSLKYILNAIDVLYNRINVLPNTQSVSYGFNISNTYNHNGSVSHRIIGNRVNGGKFNYFSNTSSGTGNPTLIYNNMISNAGIFGLSISVSSPFSMNMYHNSINLNGVSGSGSNCLSVNSYNTTGNVYIKNNIFSITGTSIDTSAFPVSIQYFPAQNVFNYNILYNSHSNRLLYRSNPSGTGVYYTSSSFLSSTAGGDSSYNVKPSFVDDVNDLHLLGACMPKGLNLTAFVPVDIDSQTRSALPSIGADEAAGVPLDLAVTQLVQPTAPMSTGAQNLSVFVKNNGSFTVTNFTIAYKLNTNTAVSQPWIGILAPCDSTLITFTGSNQITLLGTFSKIKIYSYAPNSAVDSNRFNDTVNALLGTPLSGNYIIGPLPSDFLNFTTASQALQSLGVGGRVNFLAKTSNYNENVTILSVPGSSATNSISFESMAQNPDSVTITASAFEVMKLQNASFISFKNISFKQTGTVGSALKLTDTLRFDTFYKCKIIAPSAQAGNSYALNTGNAVLLNVLLRKNTVSGGYYGMYIYNANSRSRYCIIDSNIFQNAYQNHYLIGTLNSKFNYNTLLNNSGSSNNISMHYNDSAFEMKGNNFSGTVPTFFYFNYNYGSANSRIKVNNNRFYYSSLYANLPQNYCNYIDVYNNVMSLGSNGYLNIGIFLNQLRFYHNSITASNEYTLGYSGINSTGLDFRNNIFANTANGVAIRWSNYNTGGSTTVSNEIFDYNNLYSNGTSIVQMSNNTYSLLQWRVLSSGKEANSISYKPGFINDVLNLQPNPTDSSSWSLNGRAVHLDSTYIQTDINNTLRPAKALQGVSDIGAYEFTPSAAPPKAIANPANPTAGITQSFTFGEDTVAKIAWTSSTNVPPSIVVRQYSGVRPTQIDTANGYMFFYTDIAAVSGSYNYNLSLNYKDVWLGKVSNETNIKLARKNTGIPWIAFISSLSNVDTIKNTIAANAINDVACFTGTDNSNPLPVNLLDISAYKMRSNTIVNWTTAQEINTRVFEIEKSLEIGHWLLVGKVKAAENSNSIKNYQFTDALAAFGMKKTIYYRLKIIDNDGSFTYSKIVSINLFDELKEGLIEAYPNPFSENILLKINSTQNQEVKVILRDLSGRTILNESFEVNSGLTLRSPNIVTELQSGFYFLTVEMGGNIQTLKLIKQ